MRLLISTMVALLLAGCNIGRGFQPPPEGYEGFKKHNISNEMIKQDMRSCGFPDVYHTSAYYTNNENAFIKSTLCMEKKGYITNRYGGICNIDSFKNTEACQNR